MNHALQLTERDRPRNYPEPLRRPIAVPKPISEVVCACNVWSFPPPLLNCLSTYVDGHSFDSMIYQWPADVATTAIKTMAAVTKTADADIQAASRDVIDALQ